MGELAADAFLILAAIVVARLPESWLVRTQLRAAVGGRLTGWVDDQSAAGRQKERAFEARLAARYPDDFLVQMAVALRNVPPNSAAFPPSDHSLPLDAVSRQEARVGSLASSRLRELTKRFNNRPELYAAIVRNMARSEVGLNNRRGEQNALSADDKTLFSTAPNLNAPRALSYWDAACTQGERLDPENAYFPAMRAIGFYAQHEDDRATDALERVGNAPSCNDYAGGETEAQWRLMALKLGDGQNAEPGAIPRLGEYAGLCYWHYSALRQLARVATAQAIQAEQRGDLAEGFRIRHAVARFGATLRASPNSGFISPRVGVAITATATLRPGGAPAIIESDEAERREKCQAAYKAFLFRTGHGDEARFIDWENDARTQIDAIYRDAQNLPGNENDLRSFGQLCAAWAVGIGLLTNAFVITLAGGLAALYRRFAPRFARYKNASPHGKGVWIAFHGVGLLLIGAGLCALGRNGGALSASGFGFGLMDILSAFHNEIGLRCVLFGIGATSVGGALVPLVIFFAFRSRRRRVAVGVRVAHGLTRSTVPVTLGLLALYVGVAWWTMGKEANYTYQLQRVVQGEGPYFAERLNRPWPGAYRQNEQNKETNQ